MQLIEETYFGWNPLAHAEGCTSPVWDDAEVRHSEGVRPGVAGAEHHACAHGDCEHGDGFDRVELRLLCRSCDTVHTLSGESLVHLLDHTSVTGWGQPPIQMGEVWLWPGRPTIPGGQPSQYLVTRQAATVTPATLYGIITGYRDSQGEPRWIVGAVPDETGAHHVSIHRWRHASNGLASIEDAAAWIASAELPAVHQLVVAV